MSESYAPSISSAATNDLAHSSLPSTSGTSLLKFPLDATLKIWRKPNAKDAVEPIDGGSLHVSKIIPGDGDHLGSHVIPVEYLRLAIKFGNSK